MRPTGTKTLYQITKLMHGLPRKRPKKAAKGLLKKVRNAIAAHIAKGNPAVVKVLKKVKAVVKSNPSPAKKNAFKKILKKVDKMDKTASANTAAVAKLKKDAKAAKMAKLAMTELQKTKAAALHESESMQKKLMKAKMQIQQLKRAQVQHASALPQKSNGLLQHTPKPSAVQRSHMTAAQRTALIVERAAAEADQKQAAEDTQQNVHRMSD